MKKLIIGGFILASCLISAFAGDAAVFVDTGFSSDGSVYVFGEYGKTDKSFQGWAEIYTVDIAKNDFVKDGIFRTRPTAVTAGKAGREVYDALAAKSWFSTRKYGCRPASGDQILYICGDENKTGTDEIIFKDFTGSSNGNQLSYHIRLIQSVNGTGSDVRSSFYIVMEKQNSDGTVLSTQKIGSPDVIRKGVTGYKIEKICCSSDGRGIVFIIEKTMEDATGILVRYMAEAVRTDAFSAK